MVATEVPWRTYFTDSCALLQDRSSGYRCPCTGTCSAGGGQLNSCGSEWRVLQQVRGPAHGSVAGKRSGMPGTGGYRGDRPNREFTALNSLGSGSAVLQTVVISRRLDGVVRRYVGYWRTSSSTTRGDQRDQPLPKSVEQALENRDCALVAKETTRLSRVVNSVEVNLGEGSFLGEWFDVTPRR